MDLIWSSMRRGRDVERLEKRVAPVAAAPRAGAARHGPRRAWKHQGWRRDALPSGHLGMGQYL